MCPPRKVVDEQVELNGEVTMASDLPIDFSNPAVREYFTLIRLQVLTPISLLINVAATTVCGVMLDPSIGGVSKMYPTAITPKPSMIAIYILALYIGQIGYCVLLVLARKQETKQAIIKGCGLSLVIANFVMALWSISWVLQWFLVSSILLGILMLLLLYCNIVLIIYHSPVASRPLDTAFIHAPVRLFFILPFMVLLANSILVAVGLWRDPGREQEYPKGQWIGFGIIFVVNFLGLLVVALRRDIVWCVGATWICASIWSLRPKPAPVQTTAIVFTFLHPIALIFSAIYMRFRGRRRGAIALPPDTEGGQVGESDYDNADGSSSAAAPLRRSESENVNNGFRRLSQQDRSKRAVSAVWGAQREARPVEAR